MELEGPANVGGFNQPRSSPRRMEQLFRLNPFEGRVVPKKPKMKIPVFPVGFRSFRPSSRRVFTALLMRVSSLFIYEGICQCLNK